MIIFREIFYVLSGAIAVFFAMELFWPKTVLAYFNTNWLLLLWFFVAIIVLLKDENHN